MPVFVRFMFEEKEMTTNDIMKWMLSGRYPPILLPVGKFNLIHYLKHTHKTYGFLEQRAFLRDLTEQYTHRSFSMRSVVGPDSRLSARAANYLLAQNSKNVDFTGHAKTDDGYLFPADLAALNASGESLVLEHFSVSELFSISDVIVVGETHKNGSASRYLHICNAIMGAQNKYEMRVLLDGIPATPNNEKLDMRRVQKNFPQLSDELKEKLACDAPAMWTGFTFYGIEPYETQMFNYCEKITELGLDKKNNVATWFYTRVIKDEAFRETIEGEPFYDRLMEDVRRFNTEKILTSNMCFTIKAIASYIEFAHQSKVRMDANICWGRTVKELLDMPATNGRKVKVIVLCGENHIISRNATIPVQAAIEGYIEVKTFTFVDDGTTDACYRTINGSSNYVYTIPHSYLKIERYFATPPQPYCMKLGEHYKGIQAGLDANRERVKASIMENKG